MGWGRGSGPGWGQPLTTISAGAQRVRLQGSGRRPSCHRDVYDSKTQPRVTWDTGRGNLVDEHNLEAPPKCGQHCWLAWVFAQGLFSCYRRWEPLPRGRPSMSVHGRSSHIEGHCFSLLWGPPRGASPCPTREARHLSQCTSHLCFKSERCIREKGTCCPSAGCLCFCSFRDTRCPGDMEPRSPGCMLFSLREIAFQNTMQRKRNLSHPCCSLVGAREETGGHRDRAVRTAGDSVAPHPHPRPIVWTLTPRRPYPAVWGRHTCEAYLPSWWGRRPVCPLLQSSRPCDILYENAKDN